MLVSTLFGFITCGYLILKKDGLKNTNTYMNIVLILMNNMFTISYIVQHITKISLGQTIANMTETGYMIYLISSTIGLSSVLVQYLWMPYISYVGLKNMLNIDGSKSNKISINDTNKILVIFGGLIIGVLMICNYLNDWTIYSRKGFFYTILIMDNMYYMLLLIILPLFIGSTYQIYAYRKVYNVLEESAKKTNRTNNKSKDIQKRCLIVTSLFMVTYGVSVIDYFLLSFFNIYMGSWFIYISGTMTKLQSLLASLVVLQGIKSAKTKNISNSVLISPTSQTAKSIQSTHSAYSVSSTNS
jgi:hypothetical protein